MLTSLSLLRTKVLTRERYKGPWPANWDSVRIIETLQDKHYPPYPNVLPSGRYLNPRIWFTLVAYFWCDQPKQRVTAEQACHALIGVRKRVYGA